MATKKKTAKPAAKKSASNKKMKYVYNWGAGKADGDGSMKPLLGGKGANLAEMTRIGLPVPPGFTITTEVCTYYYANRRSYPAELQGQIETGISNLEKIMGCKFGDAKGMPLLVAVRSGARDSMPGMMDTILNLGLNDQTVLAVATATKNPRFAWDCYRRFVQMYGDVVLGVQKLEGEDHEPFETIIEGFKHEKYGKDIIDSDLTAEDQQELVKRFKALVKDRTGKVFPQPRQRHQRILRRVPHQRPGRRRRRRRAHPGTRGRSQAEDAQVLRRPAQGACHFGETFQGRAGHRVYHSGRQAVHAANPQRQTHRCRRPQVLHGHGQGETH